METHNIHRMSQLQKVSLTSFHQPTEIVKIIRSFAPPYFRPKHRTQGSMADPNTKPYNLQGTSIASLISFTFSFSTESDKNTCPVSGPGTINQEMERFRIESHPEEDATRSGWSRRNSGKRSNYCATRLGWKRGLTYLGPLVLKKVKTIKMGIK
ncbi:hypothetical protein CDAR_52161 [Caerostris darwini]|uniref:Uncharacterized protein n=1 Tax=Caerostris darwini TaxID=1538125 RepID=A0AAV4NPA7_9ARAC|nr:hypothetical protein CDAR_52161 [Caerostris darwini]